MMLWAPLIGLVVCVIAGLSGWMRLRLKQYGRQCYDLGRQAALSEARQQLAQFGSKASATRKDAGRDTRECPAENASFDPNR